MIVLLPVAICLALGCRWSQASPRPRLHGPEQIILISVDALRADYLGPWRDGWGHTPNLDRFAEDSVVFTDTLTTWPDTSGAHKSMLYGLYHHVHQTSYASYPESERATSPVAVMRQAGLDTAAFFSIGRIARAIGLHHGFELFDSQAAFRRQDASGNELPELQRQAASWLARHADTPFFLFLHTYQVHAPYEPPPDLLRQAMQRHGPFGTLPEGFPPPDTPQGSIAWWRQDLTPEKIHLLRTVYEGQVAAVDRWFGELLAELARLGIAERAAIVLTADHGEALGEEGHVGHSKLGEEQLRVPLIVRVPGVAPRTVDDPVSLVDIMPTLLDLLGLEPPYRFQGTSLLDTMSGRGRLPASRLRVVESHRGVALYQAGWKLVVDPRRPADPRPVRVRFDGLTSLFPPSQEEIRDRVRRYGALLRQAEPVASLFQADPAKPTRYTEDTLRQLRHLGYLE